MGGGNEAGGRMTPASAQRGRRHAADPPAVTSGTGTGIVPPPVHPPAAGVARAPSRVPLSALRRWRLWPGPRPSRRPCPTERPPHTAAHRPLLSAPCLSGRSVRHRSLHALPPTHTPPVGQPTSQSAGQPGVRQVAQRPRRDRGRGKRRSGGAVGPRPWIPAGHPAAAHPAHPARAAARRMVAEVPAVRSCRPGARAVPCSRSAGRRRFTVGRQSL